MLAPTLVIVRAQDTNPTANPPLKAPTTQPTTRPSKSTIPAPNPHWNTTDCFMCHDRTATGEVAPIPLEQVDAICWSCHDGVRAHQEVHPVARKFVGEGIIKPEGWPAPNNELSCVTCHDFGPGHARGGPRPQVNAWMLRGYTGGSLKPFCAKCHVASPAHKPFNPHVMVQPDGEADIRNCLLCHKTSAGTSRMVRTGKPNLIAGEISLCVRCHTRHVDWFTPGHIGHPATPEIMRNLQTGERTVQLPGPSAADTAAADTAAAGTAAAGTAAAGTVAPPPLPGVMQRLPLGADNRIVCSTCHNPHEAGLFPPGSTLGIGGMDIKRPDRPQELRGLGKEICRACHNK